MGKAEDIRAFLAGVAKKESYNKERVVSGRYTKKDNSRSKAMAQIKKSDVRLIVRALGAYTRNGMTTFTFQGCTDEVSHAALRGVIEGAVILSIPGSYLNQRDSAVLSLITVGDLMSFEVEGFVYDKFYLEVDKMHSVKTITYSGER